MEKKHDLMFCPECGVKLEGDEFVCSICGHKIVEPPQMVVPPPPPQIQETPPTPPTMEQTPIKKHDLSFCPECGAKLDGDEAICSICGYKLTATVDNPVITETPAAPIPVIPEPIIEEKAVEETTPVMEQTPETIAPVIEKTIISETPVISPPPVPETVVEQPKEVSVETIVKKHDLLFCPECGNKLQGDEIICPGCGYKLTEPAPVVNPIVQPATPPPPAPTPPPPVANVYNPPVNSNPYNQPVKKKKTGLMIFLILLALLVIGSGTVAFLQYNGNINITFLESIIPQKSDASNSSTPAITDHTRYYVCHSFAAVGTKMTVIISTTIVSKQPYNNKDGAIVQFKKAISKKYPKDYSNFTTVLCDQYKSFPEATSGRSSTLKNYDAKKYEIRTVDVKY